MVVVSMAFIGIIVGALLTAAGYAYRLRMQDVNARDNFYYVEQAMNEIYAGVGSETLKNMQDAYVYTVENMVYFDLATQTYLKRSDEEAEKMFKDKFMENVSSNAYFQKANIAASLSKYISDPNIHLDPTRLDVVEKKDANGKTELITIKNVTLTRTVQYKKAVGEYTQTISTDIEIGNPDFTVLFNSTSGGSPNIFDFSLVADMGVEIDSTMPVTIAGNIYAAADYYNKDYNKSTYKTYSGDTETTPKDEDQVFKNEYTDAESGEKVEISYQHGSVTSRVYDNNNTVNNTYYNQVSTIMNITNGESDINSRQYFDGENKRSMYSGLFIDGTNVSILADIVIVPGSISVMDNGFLTVYGKNGMAASEAEIWADNFILGGYSAKVPTDKKDDDGNIIYSYNGSKADIRANMYVRDDTEINSVGSTFRLRGKYYGYGDSTSKDKRTFVPTVDTTNFQREFIQYNGLSPQMQNGQPVIETENRGHYNSSAIIVNGEKSTLNFENVTSIYLAGRSYIELSKNVDVAEEDEKVTDSSGNVLTNVQTIEFNPVNKTTDSSGNTETVFIRDYKTGESLSIKSNQVAYIPIQYTGIPTPAVALDGNVGLSDDWGNRAYDADLHTALRGSDLFEKYFPAARFVDANNKYAIPCIMQEVSGKKYYYYDFDRAYRYIASGSEKYAPVNSATGKKERNPVATSTLTGDYCDNFVKEFPTAEDYAASFIEDYVAELNDPTSTIREYLTDITDYEGFEAGDIILPKSDMVMYSSGAITTKEGADFNIAVKDSADLSALFSSSAYNVRTGTATDPVLATEYSDGLEKEYNYVKWNLGHYADSASLEKKYIDDLVSDTTGKFSEASITPINKYLNFDKINSERKLNLSSDYYAIASNTTVTVNKTGLVKGIILTKGDVIFGKDVTGFEGLVVSGGKIYISNQMQTINASAEICRAVLRECQLSGDNDCQEFLKLFKGYEGSEIIEEVDDTEAKTIDTIDYSDVVRFNNWMKNVE